MRFLVMMLPSPTLHIRLRTHFAVESSSSPCAEALRVDSVNALNGSTCTKVLWEMMMEGNADQDGDNRISEDEFVRPAE